MNNSQDLAVLVTSRDATCGESGEDLGCHSKWYGSLHTEMHVKSTKA